MSVQKLFAIFIALAVLIAPTLTRAGEAFAAVPDHQTQMMEKGHCDSPPDAGHNKKAGMTCCFQMCMAVAAELAVPLVPEAMLGVTGTAALQIFRIGTPAELATPPPRTA